MFKEIAFLLGSVIGPGIFFLPFNLSEYGFNSLLSLIFSALFFFILGFYFSKYHSPLNLIKEQLGCDFAFLAGWAYWITSLLGSVVLLKQIVIYTCDILKIRRFNFIFEILILIILTAINLFSIQNRLSFELFFSAFKIVPLITLPIIFLIHQRNLIPISINRNHLIQSVVSSVWCFSGLETMGFIVKSKKQFFISMIIITTIYLLNVYSVFAFYGSYNISPKAYLEIVQIIFGTYSKLFQMIIIVQGFNSLSSWILSSGMFAYELAEKRLMPQLLCRKNIHNTPANAILAGSMGVSIIVLMSQHNYVSNLIIKFTNTVCNLLLFFYSSFSAACFMKERSFMTLVVFCISTIIYIYSQNLFSLIINFSTMSLGLIIWIFMKKSIAKNL